ncbi:nicotinic acid mononucleotide adenyltransferase [Aureisphaera sp. CAU 1614]|uniref:Nicotinic acid mononucleotide adenyltransferase n=1 Tax=Halomarinibacterium sedimenti TaxID=2857106 RepID=A0A9X1JXW6_9FLAO|nr:nicotinic acid mononucleotide adenyltransferase [Halomarinibacterium sedimenti]MBW2938553.1 nicotinic acid mononucleotide adenyltransferase [Halomarinibacterium sedimenti]
MRKLLVVFTISLLAGSAFSQEKVQDEFVKEGKVIKATLYHENGMVAQTGFYTLDNKLEGEWISYDAVGNKTAVAHYKKGNKVGTWYFYQGNEIKEVNYSNSKVAKVTSFKITDAVVISN